MLRRMAQTVHIILRVVRLNMSLWVLSANEGFLADILEPMGAVRIRHNLREIF